MILLVPLTKDVVSFSSSLIYQQLLTQWTTRSFFHSLKIILVYLKHTLQTELSACPSKVSCLTLVNWLTAYLRDPSLDQLLFTSRPFLKTAGGIVLGSVAVSAVSADVLPYISVAIKASFLKLGMCNICKNNIAKMFLDFLKILNCSFDRRFLNFW